MNCDIGIIFNDKFFSLGDNIKITFTDGNIREGVLTDIICKSGYKAIRIKIAYKELMQGYYILGVPLNEIKEVMKK